MAYHQQTISEEEIQQSLDLAIKKETGPLPSNK